MCPIIEIIEMFLCTVTEQYSTSMLEMNVLNSRIYCIAYSTVYYDSTQLMPFNNVYCICYVEQKRTFKT